MEQVTEPMQASAFVGPVIMVWLPRGIGWGCPVGQLANDACEISGQVHADLQAAAAMQPAAVQQSTSQPDPSSGGKWAGTGVARKPSECTTILFRNLPNNYNGKDVIALLDKQGFKNTYDFVYVPHDFKRLPALVNLGYFFVNFTAHEWAVKSFDFFVGYNDWFSFSTKELSVTWASQTQGLKSLMKRYRNCPVMHDTVPVGCKPMIFKNGELVPIKPTKKIKQPRFRNGLEEPSGTPPAGDDDSLSLADIVEAGQEHRAEAEQESPESGVLPGEVSENIVTCHEDAVAKGFCYVCEEPFTSFRQQKNCRRCRNECCVECAPRSYPWNGKKGPLFRRLCKTCAQEPASPKSPKSQFDDEEVVWLCVEKTFFDVKEFGPTFADHYSYPC
jgi:hypothetical protein